MKTKREEITLTEQQLKGLDVLANIDPETLKTPPASAPPQQKEPKLSWVGKAFEWLEVNILDKSTKLIMISLEVIGVVAIAILLWQFDRGLSLLSKSTTPFDLQRAQIFLDSIKNTAPAISGAVVAICGAVPSIIGVLKTLKGKWGNGNGNGSGSDSNGSNGIPPNVEV